MENVTDYTDKKYIKNLDSTDKFEAIEELAVLFKDSGITDNIPSLINALKEREEIMSTGIGFGIAIPHAKIKNVKHMTFAVGISRKGIDFDSMDGKPVHLIILVVAGERQHKDYLRLLSRIMGLLKKPDMRDRIIESESPESIIKFLAEQA